MSESTTAIVVRAIIFDFDQDDRKFNDPDFIDTATGIVSKLAGDSLELSPVSDAWDDIKAYLLIDSSVASCYAEPGMPVVVENDADSMPRPASPSRVDVEQAMLILRAFGLTPRFDAFKDVLSVK